MIAIILGFVSGIAGGMGIGGGAILIPALVLFTGCSQHEAQAANLIFFIPTAIAALFIHIKNKSINIKKAAILSVSGISGAILGSVVANFTEGDVLRKMFGVFLIVFGFIELFKRREC